MLNPELMYWFCGHQELRLASNDNILSFLRCNLVFFFFFWPFLGPLPVAYGGSQARGRIGAVAAGLHHSHSNAESKLHLQPIPQLTAMPDP